MRKWLKILCLAPTLCTLPLQMVHASAFSSVKVDVYQSEANANKVASSITDLTYIKPSIRHVQTSQQGEHYEIIIDNLSEEKAAIVASALREKLKLNPKIVTNQNNTYRKPQRITNSVKSTTSIIQLKKSKPHANTDEDLENDFAEAKFREEIAKEKAEKEAKIKAAKLAKLEAERKKALEEKRKAEEKQKAIEAAKQEAKRKADALKAQQEAKRKAAEEKAKLEAKRKADALKAQQEAKRKAEEEAKLEAKRKADALKAQQEAKRKAAEEKAKLEAKRKADALKAQQEAKRKAAEEKAKLEAKLKADALKAQQEAKRKAAEEKAKLEAKRKADALKAQQEAERQAEEKAKLEVKRKSDEIKAQQEAKRKAIEAAQLEAKRKAEALKAQQEAKRNADALNAQQAAKQNSTSNTKVQLPNPSVPLLAMASQGASTIAGTMLPSSTGQTSDKTEIVKNNAAAKTDPAKLNEINSALMNLKRKAAEAKPHKQTTQASKTNSSTETNKTPETNKAPESKTNSEAAQQAQNTKKLEDVLPAKLPELAKPKIVKHLWNVKDADIRSVIASVSEFTGRNFVIDPRVQGKVTILSKTPLTADEIYAAFLSALQVNSYSAIDQGTVIKIIPTIDAKSMISDVKTTEPSHAATDSNLVRVITVKHVPVQQLIPVLRPLMPQWASLSTYVPSNKVIISGRKGNLDKLVKIVEEVDTDHLQQVTIVPVHYGQAEDIAKTLRTLYTSYDGLSHRVAIAADDYSNSLLISGAPADRLRIKSLVSELDSPNNASQNASTQVIYLKYLQAKDLVPILAGVAKSMFSGRVGTTIGSMTIENAERISIDNQGGSSNSNAVKEQAASSKTETAKGESGRSVEIIAEPNTNSIIINGPPNVLQTLRHVIRQVDIRPAQIIVEALITEISEDEIDQLGIDWGSVIKDGNNAVNVLKDFNKNIGIITKHGFEDFQAILRMMAEDNKANILSTPSIMVLDNHKAHIAVGNEVSIENSQYYNNGNQPTSTFERKKVALALDVTPQINQGDAIRLLISHANNTLQNANDTSGRPIFNVNEINTSVIINNGDVLVLGGLIKNEVHNNDKSVPILGHIPIIGRAFHDKAKSSSRRKLMVFLHPLIIKNKQDSQYFSGMKYDFMREAQLGFMNQFLYQPGNKEYVLPQLKAKELPKPFDDEAHG